MNNKVRATLSASLLLFVLLTPGVLSGQQESGFTIEQVISSPFPSDMTTAAMGGRIAWVFDAQGRRNVWIAAAPDFKARQLTRYTKDDGQEITDLQMTRDGAAVVFVRGGSKNPAGEVPNPTSDAAGATQAIYLARTSDGVPRLLGDGDSPVVSPDGSRATFQSEGQIWLASLPRVGVVVKGKQAFVGRGNNGSVQWAPDSKSFAFVSNRGDHSLIGIFALADKSVRWILPSVDRYSLPRFSPDGKQLAFVRQTAGGGGRGGAAGGFGGGGGWELCLADVGSGAVREIWKSWTGPGTGISRYPGASPLNWGADNRLIFPSEKDGWMHYYSIAATGGEPLLLTPGECEVETMTLTPDGRTLIYSSNCGDIERRHLWQVPVTGGQPAQLTAGEGIEWDPVVTGDGKWIAYSGSDARKPAMPSVMPGPGGQGKMIAADALPKDFPSNKLVVPQLALFKAADGLEIHGQLFLPPGSGKHAAIVFMHGGPPRQMMLGWHNRYYYHNAYGMNQYLASKGYIVLSVNYRLGIGYGRAFREREKGGARGAEEYQDIVAAGEYLRTRSDVDSSRIGLWGGSYGGYLTAMGLARNSDIFAAGVDLHGVHDWSVRVAGLPSAQPQNSEAAKLARESSPISSVATWKSPVLLIHGDDDRNVAFSQTVELATQLRRQKVHFEQLIFPDEIHDFLLHRDWLAAYHAGASFFDRELKGSGGALPDGK